jgi:purine-cytosine permease-like protein
MSYSPDDKARFKTYLEVFLRSENDDLTDTEKIPALKKKLNSKWIQLFINVAIIILFAFMYLNGYTTFGDFFYYIIFGVFAINIALIFWQRRQITELIEFLEYRIERGYSEEL